MATYYITEVHTAQEGGHQHIESVKTTSGAEWIVGAVVGTITTNDWKTKSSNGVEAKVYAVNCPHCGHSPYITTDRDGTTVNNLLSLPTF